MKFQYSLRTLFFLVLPITISVAWFSWTYSNAAAQRRAAEWVRTQNGHVSYYYQRPTEDGNHRQDARPPGTKFLRNLLGIEFFSSVHGINLDNQGVTGLIPLKPLHNLNAIGIFIEIHPQTDLSLIANFDKLEELYMDWTNITEHQSRQLDLIKKTLPNCKVTLGSHVTVKKK